MDDAGRTPLMSACETQRCPLEVIKLLVSRGAKTDIVTKDGATLLHLAAIGERIDVIDYLVKTQGKTNKFRLRNGLPFTSHFSHDGEAGSIAVRPPPIL